MKVSKYILILIILTAFLFQGCNHNKDYLNKIECDNTNFVNSVNINFENTTLPFAKSGGINIGLFNEKGEIEKDYNFNIKENEEILKYISIGNMIDKERIYKLLLFVDYEQKDFKVDNRKSKIDFTFKMDSMQSIKIPISISPLTKGLHDILFVIVKYPDNKSLDDNFRKQTDMNNLIFLRFSVVVDKEVDRTITFKEYDNNKNPVNLDGLFITKENNYKRWLSQNVSANSDMQYYIHVGNNRNQGAKKYALITLLDWKQTSILEKDNNCVFLQLNNNESVTLNPDIRVGEKAGIYDLVVILVHNPFEKCTLKNREVETGVRVGINVK